MKKNYIIFALLMMVAGVQNVFAQFGMQVWHNGSYELYFVNGVDSVRYIRFVDNIELSPLTLELQVGETAQLTFNVLPEDATDKTITWEHSANVSVSETGLVTANFKGNGFIKCVAADGSWASSSTCQVTVTKPAGEGPDVHEYVDLGLPSGTLWATCNVGARSPEEFGDYFAWGETAPKDKYGDFGEWTYYLYYDETTPDILSKYNSIDELTELLPEDDAATVNWGEDWQMPSYEQCEELIDEANTTLTWTELNEVDGILITSNTNGRSIFIPNAGYHTDYWGDSGYCYVWSRTTPYVGVTYAYTLSLSKYHSFVEAGNKRNGGFPVRPVRK